MHLTSFERRVLINQYRILACVDPGNATDHKRSVEALAHGYTSEFNDIVLGLSGLADMPADEQTEVRDILAMYQDIIDSPGPSAGLSGHVAARFTGFDGTHDGGRSGFANYLTAGGRRYAEVMKQAGKGASLLPMWRRMLAEWKTIGRPARPLTREEVDRIIRAAD